MQACERLPMSSTPTDLLKDASFVPMRHPDPRQDRSAEAYELIIEPGRAERRYWQDLWRYRELFSVLAWRDRKRRPQRVVVPMASSPSPRRRQTRAIQCHR